MPEESNRYERVPVDDSVHTDHKVRTITVSSEEGIRGLYCIDDKKIITYLFARNKGWDMDKAKEWVDTHKKYLKEYKEILVDGDLEFQKVIAVTYNDVEIDCIPTCLPFILTKELEEKTRGIVKEKSGMLEGTHLVFCESCSHLFDTNKSEVIENKIKCDKCESILNINGEVIEKGGSGSGNFGHAGRAGERGGSSSENSGARNVDAQERAKSIERDTEFKNVPVSVKDIESSKSQEFVTNDADNHIKIFNHIEELLKDNNFRAGHVVPTDTTTAHPTKNAKISKIGTYQVFHEKKDNGLNIAVTKDSTREIGSKEKNVWKVKYEVLSERGELKFQKDNEESKGLLDVIKAILDEEEISKRAVDTVDEEVIFKLDNSKRNVYGVFLVPEKADHDGDVISSEDIEKVAHGFIADYRTIDEMHKEVIPATIVESAIAWQDGLEYYGKKLSKGTWFGSIHIEDEGVWNKVKDGTYRAFSVRIAGKREKIEKEEA